MDDVNLQFRMPENYTDICNEISKLRSELKPPCPDPLALPPEEPRDQSRTRQFQSLTLLAQSQTRRARKVVDDIAAAIPGNRKVTGMTLTRPASSPALKIEVYDGFIEIIE
jgi:hypothetical protein